MLNLEALSAPFSELKIHDVVAHMPVDKSRGPDGFNGQFLGPLSNITFVSYVRTFIKVWLILVASIPLLLP